MNNFFKAIFLFAAAFFFTSNTGQAQQTFTLSDIIERAKMQSPSSKWAETRKENRFWAYRSFRTNYNP
ncbi:MAG TPA: hypothetical protein VIQ51_01050, partial [Chryseosolibacter sp.]